MRAFITRLLRGKGKVFPCLANEDAGCVDRRAEGVFAIEEENAGAACGEESGGVQSSEACTGDRDVVHEVLYSTK